jgi:hypothetical protein
MNDGAWGGEKIASPCVNICQIHPGANICVGCYRTGAEISVWSRMSAAERDAVMAELPARAARLTEAGGPPSLRRRLRLKR